MFVFSERFALLFVFFFFQAEDGIRYWSVTGVQTCALPISAVYRKTLRELTPAIEEETPAFRPAVEAALRERQRSRKGCLEDPADGGSNSGSGSGTNAPSGGDGGTAAPATPPAASPAPAPPANAGPAPAPAGPSPAP